jgi:hypothetical protein
MFDFLDRDDPNLDDPMYDLNTLMVDFLYEACCASRTRTGVAE